MAQPVWQVREGETLVGEVHLEDQDFPWLVGRFVPQPEFERIRPLFEEEVALLDREGAFDVERWESCYRQIRERLALIKPDGTPAAEFLLHVRGEAAG